MEQLQSLGINPWSMLLYLVNTGLVLVVLTKFLYKPISKFVTERQTQIEDSIEESKKLKETFEAQLKESEERKAEVEAQMKQEIENLQSFADRKKAELTAEMEAARSDMMQKAEKEIAEKKANLIKDAENDIKKAMARIILEIVENQVPEEVIQKSIASSWKSYK